LKIPDSEFDKLLFCTKGRTEIVVLCSDELKNKFKKELMTNYLVPTLKEIITFLKKENIPYTEEYSNKNSTKL
jgi:hypothetical protein